MPTVEAVDPKVKWTARVIPVILLVLVVVALYVVTGRISINILFVDGETGAGVVILVLLYFFFILMLICYLRCLFTVLNDPGVVPVPSKPIDTSHMGTKELNAYHAASRIENGQLGKEVVLGMEQFYTKDVFQCTDQGDARWCSSCNHWKPDRSHHCKELQRCIRKMDHYCPWMGGVISETSFKFFIQFNIYAAGFCAVSLGASAYILHKQVVAGREIDPWQAIIVGLGAFFFIFTSILGTNSMRFAYLNQTTIDIIDHKVATHHLAIRVSRSIPHGESYSLVTFPPLDAPNPTGRVHTFAVVQTREGENPWDLGYYENWKSIMGHTVIDWFLPIRQAPETTHDSTVSDYPLGPLYPMLRARHDLGTTDEVKSQHRRKHKKRTRH